MATVVCRKLFCFRRLVISRYPSLLPQRAHNCWACVLAGKCEGVCSISSPELVVSYQWILQSLISCDQELSYFIIDLKRNYFPVKNLRLYLSCNLSFLRCAESLAAFGRGRTALWLISWKETLRNGLEKKFVKNNYWSNRIKVNSCNNLKCW